MSLPAIDPATSPHWTLELMDKCRPLALCQPLSKHRPDPGTANHPPVSGPCLSPERVKAHLDRVLFYSPDTGEFHWLGRRGKGLPGAVAGHVNADDGYRTIRTLGRNHKAHRLAWLVVHGEWPAGEVDHINGNRLDNRIENLRAVDRLTNSQNMRSASKSNKSGGLLGASRVGSGRYQARIRVNGSVSYLGIFDSAEEAHVAYVAAKRRLHAGCTV